MVKVKMTGGDDPDIIVNEKSKRKKRANGVKAPLALLTVIPKNTRRRAGKKSVARKSNDRLPRVKNPAPPRAVEELSADEVFLQAWDYAYNVRHKNQ